MKYNKIIFIFLIFISLIILTACPSEPDVEGALVGRFTWNEWKQKAGWDKSTYDVDDYIPNPLIVEKIKELNENEDNSYSFILFTSNWCLQDCKVNMPKIMKFLDACGIDLETIPIYGVSNDKKEPAAEIAKYNIKFVPTIVILKNGEEISKVVAEVNNPLWEYEIFWILFPNVN